MGVNWGVVYGFPPAKAEVFMPQVRQLGAGFTRVTLYWSQLEPEPGIARWDELDKYVDQVESPEEGMLTLASASPWATRTSTWVYPSSPAHDEEVYYAFVRRVVERVQGRVRYFQSDAEPSSAFFWAGSAVEYATQARVFYQAVKDADPQAVVVLGGSDGLFDPTGEHPLPGQEATIEFLRTVLASVKDAFDVFDLHLYANPYTIPARVAAVRKAMRTAGNEKPIIASEYAGPSFFEFEANRRWAEAIQGPAADAESVRKLRDRAASLPVETKMFLMQNDPELSARLLRLQSIDLVVRNLLALSSAVERTAFFDLWHATDADSPNNIWFGNLKLLDFDSNGNLSRELSIAKPFMLLATALAGHRQIARILLPEHSDVYAFRVERLGRRPLLVAWRRLPQAGAFNEEIIIEVPWKDRVDRGVGIDDTKVDFVQRGPSLSVPVTDLPVLID